jgi:iron-sulfur cluster insertion protein
MDRVACNLSNPYATKRGSASATLPRRRSQARTIRSFGKTPRLLGGRRGNPVGPLTWRGSLLIVDPMSDSVVSLTPPAVEMAKRIRAKEGLSDAHALRVAVVGGGCSGFSYQLDFDDQPQEGDTVLDYDGIRVRVDPTSAEYLRGVQIDYVSSLSGGGFKFVNPNAKQTCGCGSSFSA